MAEASDGATQRNAASEHLIERLSGSDDPVLAYKAGLLADRSTESAEARALQARIPGSPAARALLRIFEQDEKTLHHVYRKWQGPHWTLTCLALIDYPPGDAALLPLVNRVYDWLFSRHFLEPPLTAIYPGQEDKVRHCASMDGNAIWYSVRLGLEDERTRAVVDRLIDWQWPDGGWNCDKRPQATMSSFQESLIPARGLWAYGHAHGHQPALDAAQKVADLVLARRASESVLDALANALKLDEAERTHLFALAREKGATTRRKHAPPHRVRPAIQQVLDAMTDASAWVRNGRHDILAMNQLAHALYSPVLADPRRPANTTRFVYLQPDEARQFFVDYDRIANDAAAMLRLEAGRNPHDKALIALVGELSTRSELFRQRWASHDVQFHRSGQKRLRQPVVGQLDLDFESMELPSEPGMYLNVYTAAAGSPTADALKLLGSWAASREQLPTEAGITQ